MYGCTAEKSKGEASRCSTQPEEERESTVDGEGNETERQTDRQGACVLPRFEYVVWCMRWCCWQRSNVIYLYLVAARLAVGRRRPCLGLSNGNREASKEWIPLCHLNGRSPVARHGLTRRQFNAGEQPLLAGAGPAKQAHRNTFANGKRTKVTYRTSPTLAGGAVLRGARGTSP